MMPARVASSATSWEAGVTRRRVEGWTRRPRRISAATARSSRRAFVQEPRKHCCTGVPTTAETGFTFPGLWGQAICGSRREMSIS
jgi:hypothetical protein